MKYFFNLFLIFYVVLKPLAPIIDYVIRYDYISQELCVNKNKPELRCNGKCHLAKEMAENTAGSSPSEAPIPTLHHDVFVVKEVFAIPIAPTLIAENIVGNYHSLFYFFELYPSVFHPPLA